MGFGYTWALLPVLPLTLLCDLSSCLCLEPVAALAKTGLPACVACVAETLRDGHTLPPPPMLAQSTPPPHIGDTHVRAQAAAGGGWESWRQPGERGKRFPRETSRRSGCPLSGSSRDVEEG